MKKGEEHLFGFRDIAGTSNKAMVSMRSTKNWKVHHYFSDATTDFEHLHWVGAETVTSLFIMHRFSPLCLLHYSSFTNLGTDCVAVFPQVPYEKNGRNISHCRISHPVIHREASAQWRCRPCSVQNDQYSLLLFSININAWIDHCFVKRLVHQSPLEDLDYFLYAC